MRLDESVHAVAMQQKLAVTFCGQPQIFLVYYFHFHVCVFANAAPSAWIIPSFIWLNLSWRRFLRILSNSSKKLPGIPLLGQFLLKP